MAYTILSQAVSRGRDPGKLKPGSQEIALAKVRNRDDRRVCNDCEGRGAATNPGTVRVCARMPHPTQTDHRGVEPRRMAAPLKRANPQRDTDIVVQMSRSATAAKPRRRLRGARQRQEQWHGAISTRSPREHRDLASTFLAGGSTVTNRWHARSRPPPRFWYVTTGKSWAKTR